MVSAMRSGAEPSRKIAPGQILLVVHDFEARSSDELSLSKGDRIELIERDDDFGDGWYLGRHLVNGNTGLFPQVYTTSAPKGIAAVASSSVRSPPTHSGPFFKTTDPGAGKARLVSAIGSQADGRPADSAGLLEHGSGPGSSTDHSSTTHPQTTPPATAHGPETQSSAKALPSTPATASGPVQTEAGASSLASAGLPTNANALRISSMGSLSPHDEESRVMNETLSVIEEHITDMNTPRHSLAVADRRAAGSANDSGSEYSNQLDHRLSYITGHETDEEDEREPVHLASEITKWSPSRVAEYLGEVGVEPQHCRVFAEQEISGEVLLAMDQASILIKDLDLGPVGRRLRTWHKIKALQDEAKGHASRHTSRGALDFASASGHGSREGSGSFGRVSAAGSVLPHIPGLVSRAGSIRHDAWLERSAAVPHDLTSRSELGSPVSPLGPAAAVAAAGVAAAAAAAAPPPDSPTRPSAASVREINHSRRHSSIDVAGAKRAGAEPNRDRIGSYRATPPSSSTSHRKQASFDRNWTMGSSPPSSALPQPGSARESYASHQPTRSSGHSAADSLGGEGKRWSAATRDLDRGYMSSGEFETNSRRTRNKVVKKRGSAGQVGPAGYSDEQRQRTATAHIARQSRYGSADSIRDPSLMAASRASASAAQVYQGLIGSPQFAATTATIKTDGGPATSSVMTSPTVTRLEYDEPSRSASDRAAANGAALSPALGSAATVATGKPRATGLRAISDAVTGHEKAGARTGVEAGLASSKASQAVSASSDGDVTPLSSKTTDAESVESSKASPVGGSTGGSSAGPLVPARRKAKQETSAYVRGLEKKTPAEQMEGCDYSGWMKKKSHKLMSTWKPRLFILRGRRLSYYYSEDDEQEKGLIDISSHRVLPADSDRIIGMHATLTGVSSSPTSPQNAQMPTMAATEAAAAAAATTPTSATTGGSGSGSGGGDNNNNIFIFKLVPPRMGLSKAVNFTKPTVHYFAVDNIQQGRLWMAALVKATIDRDDSRPLTTTYQQKTISLAKARRLRHRPPALMGLDEPTDRASTSSPSSDRTGLQVKAESEGEAGEHGEDDSGVSGMEKQSHEAKDGKQASSVEANSKTSLEAS